MQRRLAACAALFVCHCWTVAVKPVGGCTVVDVPDDAQNSGVSTAYDAAPVVPEKAFASVRDVELSTEAIVYGVPLMLMKPLFQEPPVAKPLPVTVVLPFVKFAVPLGGVEVQSIMMFW